MLMGRRWGREREFTGGERGGVCVYKEAAERARVCVCVCVKEREKSGVGSQPGLPSQGAGSWLFSGHPHSLVSGSGRGSPARPCPPPQCVPEAW